MTKKSDHSVEAAAGQEVPKQGVVVATGMGVSAGYTAEEVQVAMAEAGERARQEASAEMQAAIEKVAVDGKKQKLTDDEVYERQSKIRREFQERMDERARNAALVARKELKEAGREALNRIAQQVNDEGVVEPREVRRRVNDLRNELLRSK